MTALQLEWLAGQVYMVRVSAGVTAFAAVTCAVVTFLAVCRLARVLERLADRFDEPKDGDRQ